MSVAIAVGAACGVVEPPVQDAGVAPTPTADDSLGTFTRRALAIGLEAPPRRRVRISVWLRELPFDWSAWRERSGDDLVEARRRLLAPLHEPEVARLLGRGSTEVSPEWLSNSITATLDARLIADTARDPDVIGLDVDANYYDVVDAPWRAGDVGPRECPLAEGRCPEHCSEVRGTPIDGPGAYPAVPPLVACSRDERVGSSFGPWNCSVERSTGLRYLFGLFWPTEAGYVGWRACNEAEGGGQWLR